MDEMEADMQVVTEESQEEIKICHAKSAIGPLIFFVLLDTVAESHSLNVTKRMKIVCDPSDSNRPASISTNTVHPTSTGSIDAHNLAPFWRL